MQELKISNNFNIFHTNINGWKINLIYFLNSLSNSDDSDLIGITETLQKHNKQCFDSWLQYLFNLISKFRRRDNLHNLHNFGRNDLKIQHNEVEAVWVEIITKCRKNKICACIYRHPHQNIQYLDNCLKILNNENKEIYSCGDFNTDLLKIESVSLYQDYYNLLCSFGLLPHIIQPTRTVENQTPSVIDNIFSNNLRNEITAGNLLITFSEHLSQFISVAKENNEYKNSRDYTKLFAESFRCVSAKRK